MCSAAAAAAAAVAAASCSEQQQQAAAAAAAAAVAAAAMDEEECVLLQRCCKLLVHEIGHLLGVGHCIHYACCMQGSGHLLEDFEQPSFLCPVCKAATIVAAPGLHLSSRVPTYI